MFYDVGYIRTHGIVRDGRIEHETISAESGSDAVGKLFQRHPGGVHWLTCRPTEAAAYDEGE